VQLSPDEQIALTNRVFKNFVHPALPPEHVALLMVFSPGNSLQTYISNGNRQDIRDALRRQLEKWDAEAAR
jgi:hypothetical protein